jgi:hypothetical protein
VLSETCTDHAPEKMILISDYAADKATKLLTVRTNTYDSGPDFVTSLSPDLVTPTSHSEFMRFSIQVCK